MKATRSSITVAALVMAVFMITLSKGNSYADGKGTFVAKGCVGCHQSAGPADEKTFEDQLKKKGPELWYAGSKFKKDWLEGWLENPVAIRQLKYNSITEKNTDKHPALSKAEAGEVTTFLMTLTAKEVVAGSAEEKSTPQGKNLFQKKYGCVGCHILPSKAGSPKNGGISGPDLSEADKRLTGDWVYTYLKNTKTFKPVRRMPIFDGIIADDEMKTLAGFITGAKK